MPELCQGGRDRFVLGRVAARCPIGPADRAGPDEPPALTFGPNGRPLHDQAAGDQVASPIADEDDASDRDTMVGAVHAGQTPPLSCGSPQSPI